MSNSQFEPIIPFVRRATLRTTAIAAVVSVAGTLSISTNGAAGYRAADSSTVAPATGVTVLIAQSAETSTETTDAMEPAVKSEEPAAGETPAVKEESTVPAGTDATDAKAEVVDPQHEQLMKLAGDGDRDAALALAKHHVSGDTPDNEAAAKYAVIALADGGEKYTSEFVPNTKAWSREFWRALQAQLQEKGVYGGAIDGLPGRGTQRAVNTYAGIKPTPVKTIRTKVTRKKKRKTPRGSHKN